MNSYVLIKTPKCGSETIRNILIESKKWKQEEILDVGFQEIFNFKEKKYNLYINHILYNDQYVKHINNIMINNIIYFSCVRHPLDRAISHYYYSNHYKSKYDFNEFYDLFGNTEHKGYGSNDKINNCMSFYMGITDSSQINEEYLKNKYGLIVSLDNDFINKICKYFDIKYVNKHSNKTNKPDLIVDPKIKEKFIENNKLDYMLYEIVNKIY